MRHVVLLVFLFLLTATCAPLLAWAEDAEGPLVTVDEGRPPPDLSDITRADGADGATTLVAPDGLELWTVSSGGDALHAKATGVDPRRHAHLRPVREYPLWGDRFFALVDRAMRQACVTYDGGAGCLKQLPLLRAPSTTHRSAAKSLAATGYVRYLQTCPGLGRPCLVYGAPADVERVRDPAAPPGGWFLKTTRAADPAIRPETKLSDPTIVGGSKSTGQLVLYKAGPPTGPRDELRIHHRAFFERSGSKLHAFDLVTRTEEDMMSVPAGGVAAHDGVLYAWLWERDTTTLLLARFDGTSGAPIGTAIAVSASIYGELPDCLDVITDTRPVPVLSDGHLGFALVWYLTNEALYFRTPDAPGKLVPVPERVIDRCRDKGIHLPEELPPLWTLEKGAALPLWP